VLEIGCGTGQATRPLARLGATIVAVELSAGAAAVARHNLADFPAVTVEVGAFEDWTPPAEPFDLVIAATAFHWIDPAVRCTRTADVLRPGGSLAVVHTETVLGGTDRFFADSQDCYERFDPSTEPGFRQSPAAEIPDDPAGLERSGRFGPPVFRRYEWSQEYTTAAYLDLLMTYSNHRALPPAARDGLLACLATQIDNNHNGRITKRYLNLLTFATVS